MAVTRPRAVVVALVLAMGGQGGSFLFVNGPPPSPRQAPNFQCTESSAAPAADTVLAVAGGSITLLLFAL